jgi:hypothetical protein
MDQCSNGTTSHQSFRLLTDQGRHDLELDLEGLPEPVLDPWRLGPTHLTHRAGSTPISRRANAHRSSSSPITAAASATPSRTRHTLRCRMRIDLAVARTTPEVGRATTVRYGSAVPGPEAGRNRVIRSCDRPRSTPGTVPLGRPVARRGPGRTGGSPVRSAVGGQPAGARAPRTAQSRRTGTGGESSPSPFTSQGNARRPLTTSGGLSTSPIASRSRRSEPGRSTEWRPSWRIPIPGGRRGCGGRRRISTASLACPGRVGRRHWRGEGVPGPGARG